MHKALSLISWIVFLTGLVVTLGFVNHAHHKLECDEVHIHINQNDENYFVDEKDILALLPFDLTKTPSVPTEAIEAENIERQLNNHPSIWNAEVYLTLKGDLDIRIDQRRPIARVFTNSNESYYIDQEGYLMPLSSKFTARVMVINGHIKAPYSKWYLHDMKMISQDDSLRKITLIDDLFILSEFIYKNEFWRAQIEQVYVNKDLEIELIPRVGSHTIVLGEIADLEKKFRKLMIFYEQGLTKTGWNEYSVINLKFENQVVCTKRYN